MDENTMDGGSAVGGTPGSPNSGGSQEQNVSGGSGDAQSLQATLDSLNKKLGELDARTKSLQSDKDRGVQRTEREVNELKKKFAEVEKLKSRGLSDDDAFEEVELRENIRLISQQLKANTPAQTSPAGNGNGQAVDRASVLSQYGLDENDPDVTAAMAGVKTAEQAELAALKVIYRRDRKPTPDASAAPVATGTPVSDNSGELVNTLAKLQADPVRNAKKIKEVEEKLGWR